MHDPLREREPEAGSVAGARGVRAEERIEDVRKVLLADPLAGVLDHQPNGIWIATAPDPDRPVRGRMTDRVHEEVLQHPDHMR